VNGEGEGGYLSLIYIINLFENTTVKPVKIVLSQRDEGKY
jgi:hypothetical protein